MSKQCIRRMSFFFLFLLSLPSSAAPAKKKLKPSTKVASHRYIATCKTAALQKCNTKSKKDCLYVQFHRCLRGKYSKKCGTRYKTCRAKLKKQSQLATKDQKEAYLASCIVFLWRGFGKKVTPLRTLFSGKDIKK